MRPLTLALCVALLPTLAEAQAPTLAASTLAPTPGTSVTLTVTGAPGAAFAVVGSTAGSGFSYAGVALAVGPDLRILAAGTLDGAGRASVPFAPPFVGTSPVRYYLQAVTSPTPAFATIQASPSVVLRNGDVVAPPPGIIVNPNGTTQYASPGMAVTRLGPGTYRITMAPGVVTAPVIPMVQVIGPARVLSQFSTLTQVDLVLEADSYFHLLMHQVR